MEFYIMCVENIINNGKKQLLKNFIQQKVEMKIIND